MHQPSLYLFSQEEVEAEEEEEVVEEEAEEEVPQLHPLPLHPVLDLLEVVVVEDHPDHLPDHLLGHLLVHQSRQLPPQIPQMINWEETRHKSSQEIGKKADDSYLNFNSIEA